MYKLLRFFLFPALLLAVAACGGGGGGDGGGGGGGNNPPAACPAPVSIQPDSVTQGSLASTDCTVVRLFPSQTGDQSLLDQYVVTLPSAGELTISLSSSAFDAYLAVFLTNPPVAPPAYEDDDSGGNLDAQLVLQLNPGTYFIIANSATVAAVTGAYTLTLSFRPMAWIPTSNFEAPEPRTEHSAVWTDTFMIVWGGNDGNAIAKNSGARYGADWDVWAATETAGAPTPRWGHAAVWTGTEMLVWGGFSGAFDFVPLGDGGAYSPDANSWSGISDVGAPVGRFRHTAVWTGDEMIVWGGHSCTGCASIGNLASGGRYDPVTDTWTPTSLVGAPAARAHHAAVWTGSQMLIWGGDAENDSGQSTFFNSGGAYDPDTDTWTALSEVGAPTPARCASAVWTGAVMLVFGGQIDNFQGCGSITTNALAAYDPATDTWTDLVDAPVASTISGSKAVWTGDTMIVWFEATGARYDVASDSWSGIDPLGAPEARRNHSLVWTGLHMIVWGGDFGAPLGTGALYAPGFDETP